MGLRTNSWPDFAWVATNSSPSYSHWGTFTADLDPPSPEPNNLGGQEFCASGNSSEAWGPEAAYGWSDEDCEARLPFICEVASELNASLCLCFANCSSLNARDNHLSPPIATTTPTIGPFVPWCSQPGRLICGLQQRYLCLQLQQVQLC